MTPTALRPATDDEIATWDSLVAKNPDGGTLLQTTGFAVAKAGEGWKVRHLIHTSGLAILVLVRRAPWFGELWYIPTGPGVATVDDLIAVASDIKDLASRSGAFLVKIESELDATPEVRRQLQSAGLVKTHNVQMAASTAILDLTPDIETILAKMPQKGRYAIRRAPRDGVITEKVPLTDASMRTMYRLLHDTGDAAGFRVRSYEYYRSFWSEYATRGQGSMYFARVDGDVVAAAYAVCIGAKSWYKDGASVRDRPAYGASHALQWEIIQHLKNGASARSYDFGGTPPSDRLKDTEHSLYGIGLFKLSLCKNVVDRIGTWDLRVNAAKCAAWEKWGFGLSRRLYWYMHHTMYF